MKERACLKNQAGVTLVELIITIVVLGIAMSALLSALSTGISRSSQPLLEAKALELAQAYLDEIQAMKFDDQSPVGGGAVLVSDNPCTLSNEGQSRSMFDDVDDYHGLIDSPPALIETSIDMNAYVGYQVSIEVTCAGTELGLSANELAKSIQVGIGMPSGEIRFVTIYKGNF
jgi:MSHA pilin protein MshD